MYKGIIAIAIAAVACLAAGCGSSNDGTATATVAVTKAEFTKQAEAVCTKAQKQGVKDRIAWEKANGEEMEYENSIRLILGPTLQREAKQLQSLQAPEGEEQQLTRMINNLAKSAAAFAGEGSKSKSIAKFKAFQREAEAYGLESCRV